MQTTTTEAAQNNAPQILKVGLLIDSSNVPPCVYNMLELLHKGDYADVVVVIESTHTNNKKSASSLLYQLYKKLDILVKRPELNPLKTNAISTLFPNLSTLNDTKLESINNHQLDILINLGNSTPNNEVLSAAKYGIWQLDYTQDELKQGGPADFYEVMYKLPTTGTSLKILGDNASTDKIIYQSHTQTSNLFLVDNHTTTHWKASTFIPRKLQELQRIGAAAFFAQVDKDNEHPRYYSKPRYTEPSNLKTAALLLRHIVRYIGQKISFLFFPEQWILLYQFKPDDSLALSFNEYKKLLPPKECFWADPFVVYEHDQYHIFIEELPYKTGKGHISYMTINEEGDYSTPVKIIDKPYHLSYPFIFQHEGTYYMIPESMDNHTIELYKCEEFPHKWVFVQNLMEDVDAVDTTLLYKDDRWWMFVTLRENTGISTYDELFIFYSDELITTDWTPHIQNPVISDVRSARPAGKIFSRDGKLYRPSQNSSKLYGYGMKINYIKTLSETEYEEVCVSDIEPDWDKRVIGTHTYNQDRKLTVIDGFMKRARFW